MNIIITPAAEKFMRRMVRFANCGPSAGLRLTVTPGGCSGLRTEFNVEPTPRENELTLNVNGLSVFLPPESVDVLEGATVDFRDSGTATGLEIINPNVSSCACGSGAASGVAHATVDVSAILRKR